MAWAVENKGFRKRGANELDGLIPWTDLAARRQVPHSDRYEVSENFGNDQGDIILLFARVELPNFVEE